MPLPPIQGCSVDGCDRKRECLDLYCLMHYKRWVRHGDVNIVKLARQSGLVSDREHLFERRESGCWIWIGTTDQDGYGNYRYGGKILRAHCEAYREWIGPIPDGMLVCHTCDTPPCINPAHLWAGTPAQNAHDRDQKGRTYRKADAPRDDRGRWITQREKVA